MQKLVFIIDKMPENTPESDSIFLSGDFNGWIPDSPKYKFTPEQDGRLMLILNTDLPHFQYKVTRGSWQKAESNSQGFQMANRIFININEPLIKLEIDGWEDRRLTSTENVCVLSDDFLAPQLGTRRKINMYLPPDYKEGKKKYPVIYMPDGQNLFDSRTAHGSEWAIDKILDRIHFWDKDSVIVVGIASNYKNRHNELVPFRPESISHKLLQFITTTLKPYIDSHFRTFTDKKHTAITGSSFGGVFALYAGVKEQSVFGNTGIFSPVLSHIEKMLDFIIKTGKKSTSKFYFACGLRESEIILRDIQILYNHFRINGYNEKELKISVRPDGEHEGWYWGSEFESALRWFFLNAQ